MPIPLFCMSLLSIFRLLPCNVHENTDDHNERCREDNLCLKSKVLIEKHRLQMVMGVPSFSAASLEENICKKSYNHHDREHDLCLYIDGEEIRH